MRGPWIPRLRAGECSDEMIDGRGTEGRYFQFDWLGGSLTIQLHSTYAEDRWWKRQGGKPR